MDILRSRVGVAAVNGKVYVFGGYDGTIHRLSAVECYDPHVSVSSPGSVYSVMSYCYCFFSERPVDVLFSYEDKKECNGSGGTW